MDYFSNNIVLDEIDKGILELLQEDAKYTNKEIAGILGLSITPIYERIKRLKRRGIIKKMVTIIDHKKAGITIQAFCTVSLKEHTLDYINIFQEKINRLDEVQSCYHIAGQYDYLLSIYARDMDEYQKFITSKLAAIDNIAHVQSSFVMKEIKKEYKIRL